MESTGSSTSTPRENLPAPTDTTSSPPKGFATHFADLGLPCDDPSLTIGIQDPPSEGSLGSRYGSVCGSSGKVAGVYNPDGAHGEIPAVKVLYSGEGGSTDVLLGKSAVIGIREPYLWVRRVTCEECAAVMGWGFAGHLQELEDSQLRLLQGALDLPKRPLLRTAQDWRRAVRAYRASSKD